MADSTVTPLKVRPLGNAQVRRKTLGGPATAGNAVYIAPDGDAEAARANAVPTAQARGLVISNGNGSTGFVAGERVDVVTAGPVSGFSGLTPGAAVWVSKDNAGGVTQTVPTGAGNTVFALGYAESAEVVYVQPQSGVPVAL